MAEPLLQFLDVSLRSEEGKSVFRDMTWTLDRGVNAHIRVHAGGDATALLRLAAGLIHPQKGRILLDGISLSPYYFNHPFLQRGGVGWVPREGGLLVNQNLLANLAYPLMFTKRMAHTSAETLAGEALERAGLAEVADRRPHVLDPRQRWMGALARAMVMEPELWLVDQPLEDLDSSMEDIAAQILEQAATSSAAMIIVGEESWIPRTSTQTIGLKNGRLIPGDS